MGSTTHGLYPSSDAWLQIFALQQSHFGLEGGVILVAMLGPLGVAQPCGPRSYDGVVVATLPH